ncbi:lamin tail domain-containing protein [Neolewinella antarctica]|uniref:LTD domain-containing protein n=1 Tax=Neolewinella antarctica TaxID=442734 RepID=A0ABX0XB44_9BACT|nr:lamin tail domain-containing protein [Neolewinella antarctica]NJC26491.1 hypothetical protein [Neolewinella antarctica]
MKLPGLLLSFLISLLISPVAIAQTVVSDDFAGTELEPQWFGDRGDFVVTDGRLRLAAAGGGTSVLSVDLPGGLPRATLDSFSFEFLVDMDFAPSSGNFCAIDILGARHTEDLATGIFMKFGGVSGDQDAWTGEGLEEGDISFGEFTGVAGALGTDPATVRFRVTYDQVAGWQFFADYSGGTNYVLQGTLREGFNFDPATIRVTCAYTATRSDKFSFDDFNAFKTLTEVRDEEAPTIGSVAAVDNRTVRILFNEDVEPTTVADYVFSEGENAVTALNQFPGGVELTLETALTISESYAITITSISDAAGNETTDLVAAFTYDPVILPTAENLLITEIMVDPSPTVGQPNAEYVELYNDSDTTIGANNLFIGSGGTSVAPLNNIRIAPRSYLVLVPDEFAFTFDANVQPTNLPGLTNSGDNISLLLGEDTLVSFDYTDAWYNDPERDEGGYSIEYTGFTGADAGCSGLWRASLDESGGTPGRENSVVNQPADTVPPVLQSTSVDGDGVTLGFSEPLNTADPDFFLTRGDTDVPLGGVTTPDGGRTFRLSPLDQLETGVVYTLELPVVSDCVGNKTDARAITLGIPDSVAPGDVVINEVLFNPATGGSDFVELYNCSEKIFQIEGWTLANTQTTNGSQEIMASRLFLPGEFLVLTPDPEDLIARYRNVEPALLVEQPLPGLSNDAGNVTVSANGTVLDAFDYTDDLHSELLDDRDGVSLERLRYKVPTNGSNNWFSAASVEGYATPTRPNSQLRDIDPGVGADRVFSLPTKTFSPDEDGFEDFLEIRYQDVPVGFLARIRIFDAQGRLIRTLRNVELLGTEGGLRWDGANDDGRPARAGAYVLFVELINPDGPVAEEKLVAVLAAER